MEKNIYWSNGQVSQNDRIQRNNHDSFVLWFTGLSGSGKTTLANAIEKNLFDTGHNVIVLDGDNLRHGLCSDLCFSESDRHENIRRIGEVAKLFVSSGTIILATFVSPYRDDREKVRKLLPPRKFYEVHCDCDLSVCEERDVKGLYKRARKGEIDNFTGITAPYEEPIFPDIKVSSDTQTIDEEVNDIINFLTIKKLYTFNHLKSVCTK